MTMAISDKTRKALWARSGNRCAICRHELVTNPTSRSRESVVGEECHIISSKPGGPRYDSGFPLAKIDKPENLILLCRVHHKMVDDQRETYTVAVLSSLKENHEKWVAEQLAEQEPLLPRVRVRRIKENIPQSLDRLLTGSDVFAIVSGTVAYQFDHDELHDEAEVELVGSFLQELQDYGDLSDDLEAADRVKARFALGEQLKELEATGFLVFGGREVQRLEGGQGGPEPWPVAIINVLRSDNPAIVKVDEAPRRTE